MNTEVLHRGKGRGELGYRYARNLGSMANYLYNIAMMRGWTITSMYRSPADTRPGCIKLEFEVPKR